VITITEIIQIKEKLLLNEFKLTFYSLILYFLSWLFIFIKSANRANIKRLLIGTFIFLGILCHLSAIVLRWTIANRPPFQTLYESLIWFSMVSIFAFFVYFLVSEHGYLLGIIVLPVTFSALFYSFFFLNQSPEPLSPALNSGWFFYHALTAFGSYAVFVNNFAGECVRLFTRDANQREKFRIFSYRIVLIGFVLLTFAIVSGAVWAEEAWGRYWSWDPKETWALLTWTVYAMYIHYSNKTALKGKFISVLGILGFISMVMTFLGVNWLTKLLGIPSLHTYAL
jgi:ABC-type transport system involved in cytochrome c biogenesis permease subunit